MIFFKVFFFKYVNSKKKIQLNEHFFKILKKQNKLNFTTHVSGLKMWSFKMRDFLNYSDIFVKDMFTYLEKSLILKKY